jgi:predicted RNA-binding Zn-ribbon protein involved in translation (DUF1610 family)
MKTYNKQENEKEIEKLQGDLSAAIYDTECRLCKTKMKRIAKSIVFECPACENIFVSKKIEQIQYWISVLKKRYCGGTTRKSKKSTATC